MKSWLRIAVLSLAAMIIGCVSHEYEDLKRTDNPLRPYEFSVGDRVEIITSDARRLHLKITEISETAIVAGDTEIKFDDIRIARMENVNVEKTFGDSVSAFYMGFMLLIFVTFSLFVG